MKENLILKKYKKEKVFGTFNLLEEETFFGSKVMEIEDNISLDDKSIQYYHHIDNTSDETSKNNGFQNYELNTFLETFCILDVVKLKLNNHTISKLQQSAKNEENNTKWLININTKNILKEYLFSKIKERRTFKSLSYKSFLNKNINESIYQYIEENLYDRFKFDKIEFFVEYYDISNNSIYHNTTLKKFDPQFKSSVGVIENQNNSVNVEINNFLDPLADIKINYFQTKSSQEYKFDYYFNLYFNKI